MCALLNSFFGPRSDREINFFETFIPVVPNNFGNSLVVKQKKQQRMSKKIEKKSILNKLQPRSNDLWATSVNEVTDPELGSETSLDKGQSGLADGVVDEL